jgi:tRNA pseudouridine13 synthase
MSFRCDIEKLKDLNIKDISIDSIYRSNRELNIGDLFGNEFIINIRSLEQERDSLKQKVDEITSTIISKGGFPNYFGIQRFGSVRPITHIIGKHILKKDYKEAVLTYIANPLEEEPEESLNARKRLEKDMDFREALEYYPKYYTFERSMIHHLVEHPDDWIGALNTTPDNLKMMFVHAYQSYIFNKILSERIRKGIPLNEPIFGDIVLPLNKKNLPDHHTYIHVDDTNIENITDLVKRGLGFISGPLIGNEEKYSDGEMGEIERKISRIDGIENRDFSISDIEGLSSRGIRRELVAPAFDLRYRIMDDVDEMLKLQLNFSLFKGSYATSFMREFMKGSILDY